MSDPHGLQWREASLAAGEPTHPDSECQWTSSAIYPGSEVCKREPVAHYRAAMTPPREPRTAAGREYLAMIEAGDPMASAHRTFVLAIEAEAAGAPLREALALALHQTRTSNEAPEFDMDVARERIDRMLANQHVRAATPAPDPLVDRLNAMSDAEFEEFGKRLDAIACAKIARLSAPAPLDVEALRGLRLTWLDQAELLTADPSRTTGIMAARATAFQDAARMLDDVLRAARAAATEDTDPCPAERLDR